METGTSTSAPVVQAALGSLGVGADDLATVVVTHIHLDHAGGVGDIASMFGRAQVVVHEKGARHLADPTRLMASARQVYGDALDVLFGSMIAVEAGRLRTLDDVGVIDLAPEADPEVAEKFEQLSGAAANVSGIWHWLDRLEQPEA